MDLKNLTTFIHVAQLGSFTKAGQVLGWSQSTISFQIRQLEDELDFPLFERINRTVVLTDKGREVLAYAQQISKMTAELKHNLQSDSAAPCGYGLPWRTPCATLCWRTIFRISCAATLAPV